MLQLIMIQLKTVEVVAAKPLIREMELEQELQVKVTMVELDKIQATVFTAQAVVVVHLVMD
jgi:hypothetical protein